MKLHKPKLGTWLINIFARVFAAGVVITTPACYGILKYALLCAYIIAEGFFLNEYKLWRQTNETK